MTHPCANRRCATEPGLHQVFCATCWARLTPTMRDAFTHLWRHPQPLARWRILVEAATDDLVATTKQNGRAR